MGSRKKRSKKITYTKHKKRMNLLFTIALCPAIILAGPTSKFINSREARSVLNKGESRGFSGWIEETFRSSNMERECIEEQCNYEEWLERAENVHKKVRQEAKLVVSPSAAENFKNTYVQCYNKIKQMNLNVPDKIDFRSTCIEVFLKETFPSYVQQHQDDNKNKNDDVFDDSHYDYSY